MVNGYRIKIKLQLPVATKSYDPVSKVTFCSFKIQFEMV